MTEAPCKRGHTAGRYANTGQCIQCAREGALARYYLNHEHSKQRNRRRKAAKLDVDAETRRRYAASGRKALADWRRMGVEGPIPDYPVLGSCECCGEIPLDGLRLDHDHGTKLFRGWLCHKCNVALGMLGDSLEGVLKMINYLRSRK